MENISNLPKATPESVWALLQEVSQSQRETDKLIKENAQAQKETDRMMKELQKTVGGITNNQGFFAEEYFFNSFEKGKNNVTIQSHFHKKNSEIITNRINNYLCIKKRAFWRNYKPA